MRLIAYSVLFFAVGFTLAGYLYSNIFDPDRFAQSANVLAANSYLYGCVRNGEKSPSKSELCKQQAQEFFDELESLRLLKIDSN